MNKGIWQSPVGAMEAAVKQLQPGASEEEKVKFLQEAAINGQFRHPNVVKLMGVVTKGEPVSDFYRYGSRIRLWLHEVSRSVLQLGSER